MYKRQTNDKKKLQSCIDNLEALKKTIDSEKSNVFYKENIGNYDKDVYKRQTLRPYSPGGLLIVLTPARKGSDPPHLVIIVYSVDYQGI